MTNPHGRPRPAPPELVERIRSLYEGGLTIREVQAQLPGWKVQRIMEQHGIPRRRSGARDQTGPRNPAWKGDQAGRGAIWQRKKRARS